MFGDKLTNARGETITVKTSYRKPFEKQRCLIPADGFYEWQATATGKQPFWFSRKNRGFFCSAGLREKWHRPHRDGELGLDDIRVHPWLNCIIRASARFHDQARQHQQSSARLCFGH
jgi:putative SOS response-associated peptidase YedK